VHWLAILMTVVSSYQPQPELTEQPGRSEQVLRGFELYRAIADINIGVADDTIDDGSNLLFYRAALFVHLHGKATPTDAMKAAAIVVQIPDVKALGVRLNARPLEIERRDGANAAADLEWVTKRTATLMERRDLGAVAPLIPDVNLPLRGRMRLDILSDMDREEQYKTRWTALVAALHMFRDSSGNPAKLSNEDSNAASKLAREQLDRDYMQINGHFVCVRGRVNACADMDVDAVARALLDWVGPALIDLEGVTKLTLAPGRSGWAVVDAETGWSLKDPTIGWFSERDVLMLQTGLQACANARPATIGVAPGESKPKAGGDSPLHDKGE